MYTKRTTILTLLQFSLDIRSIIGKTATNRRLFVIVCLLLVVSFQATHRVLWNSNKASNHIFLLIKEAAYFLAFFWLSFYFSGLSEPILAQFSRNNWEYSYSKENANQNFSQPKGRREDLALCMSKCQGILKIKILLNQQVAIVSLVLSELWQNSCFTMHQQGHSQSWKPPTSFCQISCHIPAACDFFPLRVPQQIKPPARNNGKHGACGSLGPLLRGFIGTDAALAPSQWPAQRTKAATPPPGFWQRDAAMRRRRHREGDADRGNGVGRWFKDAGEGYSLITYKGEKKSRNKRKGFFFPPRKPKWKWREERFTQTSTPEVSQSRERS